MTPYSIEACIGLRPQGRTIRCRVERPVERAYYYGTASRNGSPPRTPSVIPLQSVAGIWRRCFSAGWTRKIGAAALRAVADIVTDQVRDHARCAFLASGIPASTFRPDRRPTASFV